MDYTKLKDSELAVLITTNNDRRAYTLLYSRYFNAIKNFVGLIIKKDSYKEDLTQEIFIKVLKKIHLYNPEYKFSTWVYRVATNTAIDFNRKESKKHTQSFERSNREGESFEIQIPANGLTPLQVFTVQQRIGFSVDLLNCLEEKMKNLMINKFIKEKTYKELSKEMKTPINTLKTWVARTKKQLEIAYGITYRQF